MTLIEYSTSNGLDRKFYGGQLPTSIAPPAWDWNGASEMDDCYRMFAKICSDIPNASLDLICEYWDCIGFMAGSETTGWIQVWMIASRYADEYDLDCAAAMSQFTMSAILKAYQSNVPLPDRSTIREFFDMYDDVEEYSQEFRD